MYGSLQVLPYLLAAGAIVLVARPSPRLVLAPPRGDCRGPRAVAILTSGAAVIAGPGLGLVVAAGSWATGLLVARRRVRAL